MKKGAACSNTTMRTCKGGFGVRGRYTERVCLKSKTHFHTFRGSMSAWASRRSCTISAWSLAEATLNASGPCYRCREHSIVQKNHPKKRERTNARNCHSIQERKACMSVRVRERLQWGLWTSRCELTKKKHFFRRWFLGSSPKSKINALVKWDLPNCDSSVRFLIQ